MTTIRAQLQLIETSHVFTAWSDGRLTLEHDTTSETVLTSFSYSRATFHGLIRRYMASIGYPAVAATSTRY